MGGTQSSTNSNKRVVKKKKAPPAGSGISQVDRAVLDLKNARDRLSKYQKRLELDEARLVDRARQAKLKGQTKVALQLLKIKKIKTREVEQVESQLLNILQMVQTIDSKQNEAQVLQAMKTGKDALQKMHEETSVEDVLDLMDQIQEQQDMEQEISDILQGVPSLSVEDEAAVEDELEALMEAEGMGTATTTTTTTEQQLPEVPNSQPLPVAPSTKLPEPVASTNSTEVEQLVAVPS